MPRINALSLDTPPTLGPVQLPSLAFLCLVALVVLRQIYLRVQRQRYPLPPGPPGDLVIGHAKKIPRYQASRVYMDWGRRYGDGELFTMYMMGQPVVVINTVKAAVEILDKHGSVNSDRPRFWFPEIMGYHHTLSFMRWGPRMQVHRKMVQRHLAKAALVPYYPLQMHECRRLIPRLVATPNNLDRHVRRAATAIVLNIAFGQQIEDDDDPYIQIAIDASRGLASGSAGGTTLLDVSPIFKYLPNWCAPANLIHARNHREAARRIHEIPCDAVQKQMADGTARPSLLRSFLETISEKGSEEASWSVKDAQGAAVTMYAAGQDTTTVSIVTFAMAMLNHPEIQQKAQEEVDRVIGHDRLPDMSDRPNLPYVEHVLWETYRFFPATPLGLSHRAIKDNAYKNYVFPKGTVFVPNALAMTHDPELYSEPEVFKPERYAAGEPAPVGQWGYGRRVCPGQHLASSTLWTVMATMLATVTISPALDANGKEIPPKFEWAKGFGHRLEASDCRITYRSQQAEHLILNATATPLA